MNIKNKKEKTICDECIYRFSKLCLSCQYRKIKFGKKDEDEN